MTRPVVSCGRIGRLGLIAALLAASLASCSHAHRRPPGVPIEKRPTPEQPQTSANPAPEPPRQSAEERRMPATSPSGPAAPVESVMTPAERRAALTRIAADTSSAGAAVRKCATRKLLPDQESVWDTTRSLLTQTRSALDRNELWRAESLARKARQLAASLSCP